MAEFFPFKLMPSHWHFVLPYGAEDGGMSNFLRWFTLTIRCGINEPNYHTAGEGRHVTKAEFKSPSSQDESGPFSTFLFVIRRTQ